MTIFKLYKCDVLELSALLFWDDLLSSKVVDRRAPITETAVLSAVEPGSIMTRKYTFLVYRIQILHDGNCQELVKCMYISLYKGVDR